MLPTEAPFRIQGHYLKAYLKQIRQHFPNDKLIVVGHSAGGVLARYVMVTTPGFNIDQLITIASPHLGSDTAELGKLLGDSPLALFAPMIGAGSFTRSQALYQDLLPEQPGRFLYWLNRQPHPPAEYIAIARDQTSANGGDWVVSQRSQHLEHVYALRHQAYSYVVAAGHQLTRADGRLIMDLINETRVRQL
jgi:pimeloyl-ACP methyl ester carboxylesterase